MPASLAHMFSGKTRRVSALMLIRITRERNAVLIKNTGAGPRSVLFLSGMTEENTGREIFV